MKNNNQNITDDILMAYLLGELANEQINTIELWLNESENNTKYLDDLEKVWLQTKNLNPKPITVDIDKAWKNVEAKIIETKTIKLESKTRNLIWYSYRIAAIFILMFGIFGIYKIFNNKSNIKTLASTNTCITDTLSDGSIVDLNANSQISFPENFDNNQRLVKLDGEAYFKITHNPEQPFVIDANGGFVQVVGTQFNVNTKTENKTIEVFVEAGIVKLYNLNKNTQDTMSVLLTKGEKGFIDKTTGIPHKIENKEDNKNDLYWKNKILNFEATKLLEVAKTLEKIYDVKIELSDSIKNLPLTTTYEGENIEQILDIIKLTFNLKITKKDNNYIIESL